MNPLQRLLDLFDSSDSNGRGSYHEIEVWCNTAIDCFQDITMFFESNHIDDIRDPRVRNQIPNFARRLHDLVLDAPKDTPPLLRGLMSNFATSFTTLTLALDHPEMEKGMQRNQEKDDQAANEIISEVLMEDSCYKPVKEGQKFFKLYLEADSENN